MEFEEQMMRWADLSIDTLTPAEHEERAVAYEQQARRYTALANEAQRHAVAHRTKAAAKKS